ncbi:MAG: hypothetical protein RLZZ399_1192 [Verrucomicrobiota bacterium]|jgi:hypothetical protein
MISLDFLGTSSASERENALGTRGLSPLDGIPVFFDDAGRIERQTMDVGGVAKTV